MQQITNIQELLQAKAEQINNKSNAPLYGKAVQYRRLLSICQFKLVVWYTRNKAGQPYTIYDKQVHKNINREYIPSIDLINGRTDHRKSHEALINYSLQNVKNIDKAILIVNDRINNQELMIYNFNAQDVISSQYVNPLFKDDDFGNAFYNGLESPALRIDKLRIVE